MKTPLDRYVNDLVRRRRPKSFTPTEDDLAVARVAIELSAARPEQAEPRSAFVDQLRDRLLELEADPPAPPAANRWTPGRRGVLGALAAAAAAVIGGFVGHSVGHSNATVQADADPELLPDDGTWHTVAAATELPDGAVLAFDAGPVTGFLHNSGGAIQAVSGTCTHQGCRLNLRAPQADLACPCHGATFALTGKPLTHPDSSHPLPPLPSLPTRTSQGQIQVLAPQSG
jgi:cytochrome b6-f complex iron-sulfur subunit